MTPAGEVDVELEAWEHLVHHAASLGDRRPGKRWWRRGRELLVQVSPDDFARRLVELLGGLPGAEAAGQRGLIVLASAATANESLLAALRSATDASPFDWSVARCVTPA